MRSALVAVLAVAIAGCDTLRYFVYVNPTDAAVTYVSKNEPPLRFDVDGKDWKVTQPTADSILFASRSEPLRRVNFINRPIAPMPYYSNAASLEELLQKHFDWESQYQLGAPKTLVTKAWVMARNVDGPLVPNQVWVTEGPKTKVYLLDAIHEGHLITIMREDVAPYTAGYAELEKVFHSLQLINGQEADRLLREETNYGKQRKRFSPIPPMVYAP